jgi:hypothetical protein
MITYGQGIGCKLTGKIRRHKHRIETRFKVNKHCWSTTFNSGPTRFAEKGKPDEEKLQRDHWG